MPLWVVVNYWSWSPVPECSGVRSRTVEKSCTFMKAHTSMSTIKQLFFFFGLLLKTDVFWYNFPRSTLNQKTTDVARRGKDWRVLIRAPRVDSPVIKTKEGSEDDILSLFCKVHQYEAVSEKLQRCLFENTVSGQRTVILARYKRNVR